MILLPLIISIAHYILRRLTSKPVLYPDSVRYTSTRKQHSPFHLRWLLPTLLKDNRRAWDVVTGIASILICPLTYLYLTAVGLNEWQSLTGSLIVLGLGGIFKVNIQIACLVDSVFICLCLISATLIQSGYLLLGLGVGLLSSCVKESSAVWIALYSFSFLPLALLIVPLASHFFNPPASRDILGGMHDDNLKHPFRYALKQHRYFDSLTMLLPWGACLLAVFYRGEFELWILAGVLIGYAQTFIATDSARLYQLSFPLVIYAVMTFIPAEYYLILILVSWFNPFSERNFI